MIAVNLKGSYRAEAALRLFGRRVSLWSKSGSFDETLRVDPELPDVRRRLGPLEAFACLQGGALSAGVRAAGGREALWRQEWDVAEALGGRSAGFAVRASGLEVRATVSLKREAREAG